MGLLDDAIREHLELKRRHGADPSEVTRQEHEALGPARRGAEPADEVAGDEAFLEAGAVSAEDAEAPAREPFADDEPEPEPPPATEEKPPPSMPTGEPEAPVAPPAPEDRGLEPAGDPPAEGEREDDVLEETPDFLQETPEHDRLWFEQKPPRDFEF